ncbi:MAG: GAF domain-containing protein [Anaerolineae bacterium]|nr:GAF domain-containing protein [Anaerolineae bacterium]
MLKQLSLFQGLVITLLVAGLVPLLVAVALTENVIALVVGIAITIGFAIGAASWLTREIRIPLQQVTKTAETIATVADVELADEVEQHLIQLQQTTQASEVTQMVTAFYAMVHVFQARITEFNSIYAMGQAITAKIDFEQTVQAVLDAIKQVVEFDAAEVAVLKGNKLVVEAWSGQQDFNNTTGREYQVGHGPTGMIATTKQSLLTSTVEANVDGLYRTLGHQAVTGEFMIKTHKVEINSLLGIPLLLGDRLIGTLMLVHREPGRFTEREERQLNTLAAQASIAIENAIQVRQREDVLKAQIRELRVEINQSRLEEEVEEITGSDYFQDLQANAAKMRKRVYTRSQQHPDQPSPEDTDQADVDSHTDTNA